MGTSMLNSSNFPSACSKEVSVIIWKEVLLYFTKFSYEKCLNEGTHILVTGVIDA
jgi:hypothetical protein